MEIGNILIYIILIPFFYILADASLINRFIIILILSIMCVYVEYDAFLKNQNLDDYNKALYLILDYIHIFIFLSVIFLVFITIKTKCNLNYLFLLNIFIFITILLFFYFKGCVLTLIMYNIIDTKNWINPIDRIKYMLGIDEHYNIKYKTINRNPTNDWINGQYLFISVALLLNIYYFFKKIKC
jgi:hypothetical protein